MQSVRFRRLVIRHCMWWSLCGLLLTALQPFLATHFRRDGWEDEPGFRIRTPASSTQFEHDNRADRARGFETTLFVSTSANIDSPHAFGQGINNLMALVFLLLPLTVGMVRPVPRLERRLPELVGNVSGAPPSAHIWRQFPPETAPPRQADV